MTIIMFGKLMIESNKLMYIRIGAQRMLRMHRRDRCDTLLYTVTQHSAAEVYKGS